MRQVPIRGLSGDVIQTAAERGERLSLTNNNLVCGVLLPVDRSQLARVVEANLSRIVSSIEMAEKDLDNGEVATLDDALKDGPLRPQGAAPLQQVRLGDLSGSLIQKAAEAGEKLVITNNHQVCAVLVPVNRQWMNQVAERNLSRLLHSAELAEQDLVDGETTLLDDALTEEPEGKQFSVVQVAVAPVDARP
jgi:antitoxin (DNA-binding transcriptional repressor) of toxin-antitoxin stability system